jgi:hypothetical protein
MFPRGLKNLTFCLILLLFSTTACRHQSAKKSGRVHISQTNGKFTLYKDGKPYYIKGASGYAYLNVLKQAGGNTIRIWDTTRLDIILKAANANGIAVIVGLPIPESRHMDYYGNTEKVKTQFDAIKRVVNRYKSDPAVLMWCVGNELTFPFKPHYNKFYDAFNQIVDFIHENDPDHPVTTTIVNFQRKDIFNIKLKTAIDIISFNIFGRLRYLKDDLKSFSWFYSDPYLITEWAIDGPWEGTPHTAWEAYIEPNSTNKAEYYKDRYQMDMPVNDPRYLGSFIFYWGQKQEVTSTWFSLFDSSGHRTAAVTTAREIWTGKKQKASYPEIKNMLMDNKLASDNIIYLPGQLAHAELLMKPGNTPIQGIGWEIHQEDWYKSNNVNNKKTLPAIKTLFSKKTAMGITFGTPLKEGPYRLFATVYDGNGNIATSNVPFYIAGTDGKK